VPLPLTVLAEKPFFFQVPEVRPQSLTFSPRAPRFHSHLPCLSSYDVCACVCDFYACVYAFSSSSYDHVHNQAFFYRWKHGG